jgi:hypothetical protein
LKLPVGAELGKNVFFFQIRIHWYKTNKILERKISISIMSERQISLLVLFVGPEKGRLVELYSLGRWKRLTSESAQGASLPLEGMNDIHGSDGLPLGMFGVGDGIPDDILKEDLEDSTGLLIDENRDTLDSSMAS